MDTAAPELNGKFVAISANTIFNEQIGAPFYVVRIMVPGNELGRLNGQTLIPGMPVDAFIKTQDRSALSYLFRPMMDQIQRAFCEE